MSSRHDVARVANRLGPRRSGIGEFLALPVLDRDVVAKIEEETRHDFLPGNPGLSSRGRARRSAFRRANATGRAHGGGTIDLL